MRASRGLKWENKTYKLKRSIGWSNDFNLILFNFYCLLCKIFLPVAYYVLIRSVGALTLNLYFLTSVSRFFLVIREI